MYVYVCAEENNFLNCCSVICFVSGDHWIYVHLLLMVYWFLCMLCCVKTDGYWSVEAHVGGEGGRGWHESVGRE
jgi:hypothetical protein